MVGWLGYWSVGERGKTDPRGVSKGRVVIRNHRVAIIAAGRYPLSCATSHSCYNRYDHHRGRSRVVVALLSSLLSTCLCRECVWWGTSPAAAALS